MPPYNRVQIRSLAFVKEFLSYNFFPLVSFAIETQRTLWVNVEQIKLIVINKDKGMKAR